MSFAPQDIETIVRKVVETLQNQPGGVTAAPQIGARAAPRDTGDRGLFDSLDDAIAAAKEARLKLDTVAVRQRAVKAIREAARVHARALAEQAVAETGMGRVEDKVSKNLLQAEATPGGYYGPTGFMEMKGQPGRAEIRPQARDAETARRLWSLSEQMTGVAFG